MFLKAGGLGFVMEKYYFKSVPDKSRPKESILVPRYCAKKGEELVKLVIEAKTPLELAEVFSKYSYLDDKVFNSALDLSERTSGTKKSLEMQDGLYFLNYLNYIKEGNHITPDEAYNLSKEVVDAI